MEDHWNFYTDIDFADETILQFNIDTRDFHCIVSRDNPEKTIDVSKIKKYPERFFYTAEEVKETITRLFNESGGKVGWRALYLDGDGVSISGNWQLKYIRIHRMEHGLLICNNAHYAISKNALNSKVNQKYLCAH